MPAIKSFSSDISSGPPKFELMLALFDRKVVGTRTVEFKLGEGDIYAQVVISGVEVEDGSGESWLFKGYVQKTVPHLGKRGAPDSPTIVTGWYRTDIRKGLIKFVND